MRTLACVLLLFVLPSCSFGRAVGEHLCESEAVVSGAITEVTEHLGIVGTVLATALTATLSFLCNATAETLALPDTLWRETGLGSEPDGAPAAPAGVEDPDGMPRP